MKTLKQTIRKNIIKEIELINILWRYKKYYINYYFLKKAKLYACLKKAGCKHIKAVQPLEWKIQYGSYYFRAVYNKKPVFIKVTGLATTDGYINELVCDKYIKQNSFFLSERTPQVLLSFINNEYHVIVFELYNIYEGISQIDLQVAFSEYIKEYTRVGIIHQDIKNSNLTFHNGKYCLIDYGYAICPDSDHIRRVQKNYINDITDKAKSILADADFYYDDVIASGIENIDRNTVNFIVGKKDKYIINLAGKVYMYHLEHLEGRPVCLLHKC